MSRSHVTIRDVAARAGVSHQTVSRVINGSERVNPETREKVEKAIAELGFTPNAIARFMAQGHTCTLGCISPNLTDYTFACIIEGAEIEARLHGYFLISASAPDEETFNRLVAELISSQRTEGLMVINPYADLRYQYLPENVPTVFLGAQPRHEKVAAVSLDDYNAGRIATQHLLSLGHQKIMLITGPICEDCSQDRLAGYQQAFHDAGLEAAPELIVEGDWSATAGYLNTKKLLEIGQPFSAIFAQNDRMAVGAIQALRESHLKVPDDISVIGFDDIPLASYFDPPLTTIRQDTIEMGKQAARYLINSLENPDLPRPCTRLPGELVLRHSTTFYQPERLQIFG